jgi:dTDP-glucose pyrophosphorylase
MSKPTLKSVVQNQCTLKEALLAMDSISTKVLFVTDKSRRLLGSVSDGDIRRAILSGLDLNCSICEAMNKTPIFIVDSPEARSSIKDLFLKNKVNAIPVLDTKSVVVDILTVFDVLGDNHSRDKSAVEIPVVIAAGGKGTRLYPLTKVIPKPLIPIGEKSMLEIIMERFTEVNAGPFYISVNYRANLIKAYLSESQFSATEIHFLEEEEPLGTAGFLSLLKHRIDKSFFMTNCDILVDISLADLYHYHNENGYDLTIVGSVKDFSVPYGVLELSDTGELKKVIEKPTSYHLVNTGLYVISPSILTLFRNTSTKMDMDTLISKCLSDTKRIGVFPVSNQAWSDMGQHQELMQLQRKLNV